MLIHFVTDEPKKISVIRAMVEPFHRVAPIQLNSPASTASEGVIVVDTDLRQQDCVESVRTVFNELGEIHHKLFVVANGQRVSVAQAYALGATGIIAGLAEVLPALGSLSASMSNPGGALAPPCPELSSSAKAFASLFTAVSHSRPINLADAEHATAQVIEGVGQNGLRCWLDDVRRHHEGTFQHCLLVTGIAVGFALHLHFSDQDVRRLALAATLHDVGKAFIPVTILDKPGRLDATELEVMRRHPVAGYDALKELAGVGLDVLDAVRHHHEYLDGSGYPDALIGQKIPDLARLLTISDIFAALIEVRSYKPSLPRQEAYRILCEMDGKLEMPLVEAFKHVALVA